MKAKIRIPESLNEITLGQFQRFDKIRSEEKDIFFLSIKMIEIFCNVPAKVVLNMKATDINHIIDILNDMLQDPQDLVMKFKMDGVEYGFEPNLDEMCFGVYMDVDTYLGDVQNMHIALNALYRPIDNSYGDKYNLVEYDAHDPEKMKEMPLDVATSAALFFYNLGKDLSIVILSSTQTQEEENLVKYLNSDLNGDGTIRSMLYLREILEDLKISKN